MHFNMTQHARCRVKNMRVVSQEQIQLCKNYGTAMSLALTYFHIQKDTDSIYCIHHYIGEVTIEISKDFVSSVIWFYEL